MAEQVTIKITAQDSGSPQIQKLVANIQNLARQAGAATVAINQTSKALQGQVTSVNRVVDSYGKLISQTTTVTSTSRTAAGTIKNTTKTIDQAGEAAKKSGMMHGLLGLAYRRLMLTLTTYFAYGFAKQLLAEMDAWQNMRNLIRTVTSSTGELVRVQHALYQTAQDSRTGMKETATIYARLARSSKNLGMTQKDMLTITKAINQGFIVSGATAAEAHNAMIQLSQGFASGTLRGDELRSVMEQASYLARKMAENLGMTLGEFRKLSIEGKISVKDLAESIKKASLDIQRDFDRTTSTLEQGMTKISNAWGMLLDSLNREFNVTGWLSRQLGNLADLLNELRTGRPPIMARRERWERQYMEVGGDENALAREDITKAQLGWLESYKGAAGDLGSFGGRNPLLLSPKEIRELIQEQSKAATEAIDESQSTYFRRLRTRFAEPQMDLLGVGVAVAGGDVVEAQQKRRVDLLNELLILKEDELEFNDGLIEGDRIRQKAADDLLKTQRDLGDLIRQFQSYGATGNKYLVSTLGIGAGFDMSKVMPAQWTDKIESAKATLATWDEKRTEASEREADSLQIRSEKYAEILETLKEMNAPADALAHYIQLAMNAATGMIEPTKEELRTLQHGFKEFKESRDEWERRRRSITTIVPPLGVPSVTAGAGFRLGGTGTGLSPSMFETGEATDYTTVGEYARTLDYVRVEMGGLIKRSKELKLHLDFATDDKVVTDFYFAWDRFGTSFRRMWFADGGIFKTMGAAFRDFRNQIGTFTDIIYNATTSGLQTFRAGLADAFGDLIFGDNQADQVKKALQYIGNTTVSPDSVLDVLANLDMTMVDFSEENRRALQTQFDEYFRQAMAVDDLPQDVKAKLSLVQAQINALLLDPSPGGRDALVEMIEEMIENFTTRKSGMLDRFKEFGSDIVNAIQDGWKDFSVNVLTDLTMKALVDFGTGLVQGLTGTSDETIKAWGVNVGKSVGAFATGWINQIKEAFYGLDDFLAGIVIGLGKAIAVTVDVVWDWGSTVVKNAWEFMVNGLTTVTKTAWVEVLKSVYWVKDIGADGIDKVWAAFTAVTSTVTKTVNVALVKAGDWIGTAANAVYSAFTFVGGTAIKTISVVINKAGDWIGDSANAINNAFTFVGGTVTKTIDVAINKAGDWAGLSANAVYNAFTSVGGAVTKTIELAITTVGTWTADVWNLISMPAGSILGTVTKAVAIAFGGALNFVGDLWNIVQTVAGGITSTVKKSVVVAYGGASGFVGDLWNIIQTAAGGITSTVTKAVVIAYGGAVNFVGDLWNIVQTGAGGIASTVYKAVAFAYGGAVNFVGDLWNIAQATAGAVVSTVKKAVSFALGGNVDLVGDLWNIVQAVSGTVVSSVTKAVKFSYGGGLNFVGDLWNILTAVAGATVSTVKKGIIMLFGGAEGFTDEVWQLIEAGAGETVNKAIRFVFGGTMNFVGDLWNIVKALGGTTVSTVNKAVAFIYGGVVDIAGELWNLVQAAAGTTASTVNKAIRFAYGGVLNLAGELWNIVQAAAGSTVSTVSKAIQFIYGGASGFVGDLWNIATALGGGLVGTIKKGIQFVYDSAIGFVGDLWNVLTAYGGGLVGIIKKGVQVTYEGAIGFVGDLWNIVTAFGGGLVSTVKKGLQFVLGTAIDFVGDLWEIAKAAPGAIVGTVQKIISFVAETGTDFIGGIGGAIGSFWDWITKSDTESQVQKTIQWVNGGDLLGTEFQEGGSTWSSIKVGLGTAIQAAFAVTTIAAAAYLAFSTGQIGTAVGAALGGVIGAAFGSASAGVAAGSMVGSVWDYLQNKSAEEAMANLQLVTAQRGGLIGAVQYAGYGLQDVTTLTTMRDELFQAIQDAYGVGGGDYITAQLRTALQIGEDPAYVIWRMLYKGTQNPTEIGLDRIHSESEWMELMKGMRTLGLPISDVVKVYGEANMWPAYQAGTMYVPGSPSTPVPAILHGGEMVLPYGTAEAIRQGGSVGSGGMTFIFNISGNSDEGMVRLFRERVTPELDRHMRRYLQDKSKYGQLEINNRVIRSTIR